MKRTGARLFGVGVMMIRAPLAFDYFSGFLGVYMQREPAIDLADKLNVAPLGVGAWAWGSSRLWGYGKEYNRSDVGEAFRASMAEGVTLLDTAEMYGNGASERIIGELLREGGSETTPVIATKFAPLPYRFSARSLLGAVEKSLKRLGVETIDLYQIHFPSPILKIDSLMDALAETVRAGKVQQVGVSNYSADQMKRAHDSLSSRGITLASNQVEYSLLQRAPETDGVLEASRDLGVTLIAYSPIAQGLLTGKYGPGDKPPGLMRRFGTGLGIGLMTIVSAPLNWHWTKLVAFIPGVTITLPWQSPIRPPHPAMYGNLVFN